MAHPTARVRSSGIYGVTVDGVPAGSESWTLDRDGVTLQARSTIAMRLPEPNSQELRLAAGADGTFLELEAVLRLGGTERRAVVTREGALLRARVFEENAPAYEDDFRADAFERVGFGSILTLLPVLASGRPRPDAPHVFSGLLLTLPDLRPLEVRERVRDQGAEMVTLTDGSTLEARRLAWTTEVPGEGSLESVVWVDAGGLPLLQALEHGGRVIEVALVSREERRLPAALPLLNV
jgi:hypothetical protein